MRSSSRDPLRKSLLMEIFDGMKATTTVSTFFAFFPAIFSYITVGGMVAEELDCDGFMGALFNNDSQCESLRKIAILNGGAVWAEGDIITNVSIVSSALGILLGIGSYVFHCYHPASSHPSSRLMIGEESTDAIDLPDLEYTLLDTQENENELEEQPLISVQTKDYMSRIKDMVFNAWLASKFGALLGIVRGTPIMFDVAREILHDFGCDAEVSDLFLFYSPSKCSAPPVYWAMTAFAYPWAYSTWLGYIFWELSIAYQALLPRKIKNTISSMFSKLAKYFHIDQCSSASFFQDLFSFVKSGVKALGIFSIIILTGPVLYGGLKFSNAVLKQSGCDLSLLSVVFSGDFNEDSPMCSPLLQILGMDSFPTKTEVYDLLPLIIGTLIVGAMIGLTIGGVKLSRATQNNSRVVLRRELADWHEAVDNVYSKGFYSSLMFIPISAYGIYNFAIPKANKLLEKRGCGDLTFPSFIYDFKNKGCSALNAYRANAAYVSTMWIIFSYSIIIFGSAGMAAYLGYKYLPRQKISAMLGSCRSFFDNSNARNHDYHALNQDGPERDDQGSASDLYNL